MLLKRFAILGACLIYAGQASSYEVIDDSQNTFSQDDINKIANLLDVDLRDPKSLQLRKLKLNSTETVICGEMNAKNGFGGYVGYVPFLHVLGTENVSLAERKPDNPAFEELIKIVFRQHGCPSY